MSVRRNLELQIFGRLTAMTDTERRDPKGTVIWLCQCSCTGVFVEVTSNKLLQGHTNSCGCLRRERLAEANTHHGYARRGNVHPLYKTWKGIHDRCCNSNNFDYRWWGARGIAVCDEWNGHDGFPTFLEHVSALPHYGEGGRTLDRTNNDGDYEPGNVRWATHIEQAQNRRERNV